MMNDEQNNENSLSGFDTNNLLNVIDTCNRLKDTMYDLPKSYMFKLGDEYFGDRTILQGLVDDLAEEAGEELLKRNYQG